MTWSQRIIANTRADAARPDLRRSDPGIAGPPVGRGRMTRLAWVIPSQNTRARQQTCLRGAGSDRPASRGRRLSRRHAGSGLIWPSR